MHSKQLALLLLGLTAIPLSVLLGMVMAWAQCNPEAIFFATTLQVLAQWIATGVLAEGKNAV
jgi:hypothetical protein